MAINYYGNEFSDDGVIIILGTISKSYGDDNKYKTFQNAIKNYETSRLMTIDFEDKPFAVESLAADLKPFINSHAKTTIVIAIHGSQILPYSEHYSLVGPEIMDSPILSMVFGGRILSSDVLASISQAAENKPVDVWQYTCQGAKILDKALEYLPYGSTYVAESDGFISSEYFLKIFTEYLANNKEIDINNLYIDYLLSQKNSFSHSINNDPIKVYIDGTGDSLKALDKADILVKDIINNKIYQNKLSQLVDFFREKTDMDLTNTINSLKSQNDSMHNFSNCVDQNAKTNYVWSVILDLLGNVGINYFNSNNFDDCLQLPHTKITEENGYVRHIEYSYLSPLAFAALGEIYSDLD